MFFPCERILAQTSVERPGELAQQVREERVPNARQKLMTPSSVNMRGGPYVTSA